MPRVLAAGNSCLFSIISIGCFGLLVFGIGVLVMGIYLITIVKHLEYLMIAFMSIGFLIAALGGAGFCLKRSVGGLMVYIVVLFILAAASIVFTAIFAMDKSTVLSWAMKGVTDPVKMQEVTDAINKNYPVIQIVLIILSSLVFIIWILAVIYQRSTSGAQIDQANKDRMYYNYTGWG